MEGFTILLEPYEPYELALAAAAAARQQQQQPQQPVGHQQQQPAPQMEFANPRLELACLDATLAMKAVVKKFPRVVITSGTLSPPGLLPRIIGMTPAITLSLGMTLQRPSVCPLIITRGSDQGQVSTKFDMRNNLDVARNYGLLLLEFASIVPDGMVCFFPSYQFMEMMVSVWNEMGILHRLVRQKLLFVETEDLTETSLALHSYKKACDAGRGAVFFSVARGKVSEGIDFDNHYGRCVILFGIPFVYTESRVLKARLEFLRAKFQIHENEFLTFDAMRMASQCVGRVVRGKSDYGIMVFADKRYNRMDKRSKLPQWITQFISPDHLNLSTDTATSKARAFLKEMGQPVDRVRSVAWQYAIVALLTRLFGARHCKLVYHFGVKWRLQLNPPVKSVVLLAT
jgi:DNA excision repair protein ERCC-2